MRVLFVVIPEKGHINPYVAPAEALASRGHEVAFYAVHDVAAHLARAGFDRFYPGSAERPLPPDGNRGRSFAANVRDGAWLRRWIETLLVDNVPPQVEVLRGIAREAKVDVLVIDPMVYQGAIAAELEGLPWVGLSSSLNPVVPDGLESELIATVRHLAPARDALFARYGLSARFRVCDCLSRWGTTAFTTEALVGAPPPGVALVGPSLPRGKRGDEQPFPWERLEGGAPVVLMSLGSQIYWQPEMFRTAIEAVRGKQVKLVLSASELCDAVPLIAPDGLPDNVILSRYLPQLELLPRVRAMITHGGANSVMEALSFGVPLLIDPICNDQPHQAMFLERAQAGLRISLARSSPSECWTALEALLAEGPYRSAAARIRESYASRSGGLEAAKLVERAVEERAWARS